ncbi:MAG: hypothetical protein WCD47_22080 [Candidatus Sulfotelmatobacter sp.]
MKKKGRVKRIHCLSAFPDEAKAVTDAPKERQSKGSNPNAIPLKRRHH